SIDMFARRTNCRLFLPVLAESFLSFRSADFSHSPPLMIHLGAASGSTSVFHAQRQRDNSRVICARRVHGVLEAVTPLGLFEIRAEFSLIDERQPNEFKSELVIFSPEDTSLVNAELVLLVWRCNTKLEPHALFHHHRARHSA